MNPQPGQMCMIARQRKGISESILSFSCGKDSLAAWCCMADEGIKVIPVYHYIFPRLDFVEKSLAYYEKRFQQEIIRLPHPWLNDLLYYGAFVDPVGMRTLTEGEYTHHKRSFEKYIGDIRQHFKKPYLWCAIGVKGSDSLRRSTVIAKCLGFHEGALKWYPLAYSSNRVVYRILRKHNMPLPDDYFEVGRSHDVLTYQHAKAMAKHHPSDWRKVLECFPLAEAQLMRATI